MIWYDTDQKHRWLPYKSNSQKKRTVHGVTDTRHQRANAKSNPTGIPKQKKKKLWFLFVILWWAILVAAGVVAVNRNQSLKSFFVQKEEIKRNRWWIGKRKATRRQRRDKRFGKLRRWLGECSRTGWTNRRTRTVVPVSPFLCKGDKRDVPSPLQSVFLSLFSFFAGSGGRVRFLFALWREDTRDTRLEGGGQVSFR